MFAAEVFAAEVFPQKCLPHKCVRQQKSAQQVMGFHTVSTIVSLVKFGVGLALMIFLRVPLQSPARVYDF